MTDDFAAVDAGDTARLVAMMRATDAWPAVHEVRTWVLDHAAVGPGSVVVDAGCGPGTFGELAARRGAAPVDVDLAHAMLAAIGRAPTRAVCGDVARLPLRPGAAALTRAERVLQWVPDPTTALAELRRVTMPGGWLAVTDTDWETFRVAHDDPAIAARWSSAALGWVPHADVAASLPERVAASGATVTAVRRDTVTIDTWDPDDPDHTDGPPGLPLRSIAAGAPATDRHRLVADIATLADRARRGGFAATLTLVTVVARIPPR